MKKVNIEDDQSCFACGMENLEGLRIPWNVEGQTMWGEYIAEKKYQGWKGILHGGILATLLDEAMTRLACHVCGGALTAEMTVRYVAPAEIGQLLFIKGEIVKESRKIVELKASIHALNLSGELIAYSKGKAIKV